MLIPCSFLIPPCGVRLAITAAGKQAVVQRAEADRTAMEQRISSLKTRMSEMRSEAATWEEKIATERARLGAERASVNSTNERLQKEVSDLRSRLMIVSTERDHYQVTD